MLNEREVKDALRYPKPATVWKAEPLLGSTYGEEEVQAAVAAIREAMDIHKGFGFGTAHTDFEQAFAKSVAVSTPWRSTAPVRDSIW